MYYLNVQWRHEAPNYPVEIWSELDADRFETRKLERYATGAWKCWSTAQPEGLGTVPVPALATIQEAEEFTAQEIDRATFEQVWKGFSPAEN
ncbi:hypothetical protein I2I05_21535 [Hymenobacter sp. BT683]|uniref:DUF6881 domain-containing protein n=2 Tax=Hymenobacter jeongseonensis TaxID=2791027 RepID=A0ABS0INP0_9BACT|nr:hypothetical protein [Hymenobacter jeongseonensis]